MAKQRRGGWQGDLRLPDGRRQRLQFQTKAQAEAWEAAGRAAIEAGDVISSPKTTGTHRDLTTWGGLFQHTKHNVWYAKSRRPENLVRNAREVVEYFGADTPVADCTKTHLQEFAEKLSNEGKKGSTINRKMAAASVMLREAFDARVITHKPTIPLRPEGPPRCRYLTKEEEDQLLAHFAIRWDRSLYTFCVFLLDTGARAFSEAAQVRWEDLNAGSVTLRGEDQMGTKNGGVRRLTLSRRAAMAVEEMALGDRYLGSSAQAGPWSDITSNSIRSRWDKMRDETGLTDVTPHVLRHTCASRFVMAGVDLYRVSKWLGHKSIVMTERYSHLAPEALDGMAELQNNNFNV